MAEFVERTTHSAIEYVLRVFTTDLGETLMRLLEPLLSTPIGLLADLDLLEMIRYTRILAWMVLPVILTWQAIRFANDRAEGAATESVSTFLRRAVYAAIGVSATQAITGWMLRFADSIIQSFLHAGTGITPISLLLSIGTGGFSMILLVLILIIAFIVLMLQRAILNAALAWNMAIGPLTATSLAWSDTGPLFNTWLRETISIILTFVFHTVMLWWLLRKIGSFGTDALEGKLLILGIVVLMIKGSETIRQLTYAAGGGGAVLAAGASTGRMAMTYYMFRALPRAVFRKG